MQNAQFKMMKWKTLQMTLHFYIHHSSFCILHFPGMSSSRLILGFSRRGHVAGDGYGVPFLHTGLLERPASDLEGELGRAAGKIHLVLLQVRLDLHLVDLDNPHLRVDEGDVDWDRASAHA